MKEIELINSDAFVKVNFDKSDLGCQGTTLSKLLVDYRNTDNLEARNTILERLIKIHKIDYNPFHSMRRAFRNRGKYWAHPLNNEKVIEAINTGNFKFVKFTFNSDNNAYFRYNFVEKFDFKNGLSCYSLILIKYIIETYDEVQVVKGRNDLSDEENIAVSCDGNIYDGQYNIAMLKCKLKNPEGTSEEKSFHYYDVVHDPGGEC